MVPFFDQYWKMFSDNPKEFLGLCAVVLAAGFAAGRFVLAQQLAAARSLTELLKAQLEYAKERAAELAPDHDAEMRRLARNIHEA